MQLSIAAATDLAVRALTRAGMTAHAASLVANHLVDANLCGHEFSGLPRVLAIAAEVVGVRRVSGQGDPLEAEQRGDLLVHVALVGFEVGLGGGCL